MYWARKDESVARPCARRKQSCPNEDPVAKPNCHVLHLSPPLQCTSKWAMWCSKRGESGTALYLLGGANQGAEVWDLNKYLSQQKTYCSNSAAMARRGRQRERGFLDTDNGDDSGAEEQGNSGQEKRNRVLSPSSCGSCGVALDRFHPPGVPCDRCVQTRIVEVHPWRDTQGASGSRLRQNFLILLYIWA